MGGFVRLVPARQTMARVVAALVLVAVTAELANAAGLGGSPASMRRQHGVAVEQDYSFLRTGAQVEAFAEEGRLEPVVESEDLALSDVSYPYARSEVLTFIQRLAAQYRAATGERLVVTSLVRPRAEQPSNASPLSVHPAGMAVDLRVPADPESRKWLEETLLSLERRGVLDATRERRPPHYHVAVFPAAYRAYLAGELAADSARQASLGAKFVERAAPARAVEPTVTVAVPAPAVVVADVAPARAPGGGSGAGLGLLVSALLAAGAIARYRIEQPA